jgi:hypothetical protein
MADKKKKLIIKIYNELIKGSMKKAKGNIIITNIIGFLKQSSQILTNWILSSFEDTT